MELYINGQRIAGECDFRIQYGGDISESPHGGMIQRGSLIGSPSEPQTMSLTIPTDALRRIVGTSLVTD